MTTAAASSPTTSPWWWTHGSIEDAAEPLDPTADDAAAHCLATVTAQTTQHIVAHGELHLRPHLNLPSVADTAAAAAAAELYDQLRWDSVLPPLLGQLRKAMARAWEERAAEQAEAAAVEGNAGFLSDGSQHHHHTTASSSSSSSQALPSLTQELATAAACADPVLLRRLRVLQQQIHQAFLKAVLQGMAAGIRAVLSQRATAGDEAAEAEGTTDPYREAHESCTADAAARALALLLDGLLARWAEVAAVASASAVTPSSASTPASCPVEVVLLKTRRSHHPPPASPSAAAAHPNSPSSEWFAGMMPLYMRAAQRSARAVVSGTADNHETSAPSPLRCPPSAALCLISYAGTFVQGGGLQFLPSEQAVQLPLWTATVHRVFLADLKQRCEAALDVAATITTADTADAVAAAATAATAAVSHIRSANLFLQHLTDAQLYSRENGAMEDDDCTALFHAPPTPPPTSTYANTTVATTAAGGAAATAAGVDFSVASLLALTTCRSCSPVLSQLRSWWTACCRLLSHARTTAAVMRAQDAGGLTTTRAEGETADEEDAAVKQRQLELDRCTALLKDAEDTWLLLRRHAMTASLILSNYTETTLLLLPYTAFLTRLFYTPLVCAEKEQQDGELALDAWKACIRELHHITRAACNSDSNNSSSSGGGGAGVAAGSATPARPLRPHYRGVGSVTFPAACFLRVPTVLSDAAGGGLFASADVREEDRAAHPSCSANITPKVLPLAFSLLHQPLTVLQDRILHMLMAPSSLSTQMRVDPIVGEKGSVADKAAAPAAPTETDVPSSSPSTAVAAAPTSARARAVSSRAMTADQLVELTFPRHYRLLRAMDLAMQYAVLRLQELVVAVDASSPADVLVSSSALPALLAQFFGAALDEAFVVRMRTGNDEVCGSELLMFYAALFRSLPDGAFPRVRAALATFLGHDGVSLLPYLRHHIVDQQRYGLVAFFLPPLRALGLDYGTVEETNISLALAAKSSYAAAMAYAWELPRLYFWRHGDTPVVEAAWNAQGAAQQYLCELMDHASPTSSAFQDVLQEASAVAHQRFRKTRVPPFSEVAAIDSMTSLFLGVCRWCAVQLASPLSPVCPREAIGVLLKTLGATTAGDKSAAPHPFLALLQTHAASKPGAAAEDETKDRSAHASTSQAPSSSPLASSRVVRWCWACTYDVVAPAHLQACAKRLLRDFSIQFSQQAPLKTVLGIRAMVEQRMKAEEASDALTALQALTDAMHQDVAELLARQLARETAAIAEDAAAEARGIETVEGAEESVTPAAVAPPDTSAENKGEERSHEIVSDPVAATPVLAGSDARAYVDELLQALVTRARLSPVDGAVCAAALVHVVRGLSDPTLPMQITPQDRQRMCERFVFTLTSVMPDLTRMEMLSCACSLHLVLENVVIPFKKSFLEKTPSLRVFHGCLSDNEGDAFKMVQHTFGDIVTAFQKLHADGSPVTSLTDWKSVLLLEHTGTYLSLVRSSLEKVRVTVRKLMLQRKSRCVEMLHQQLLRMEKEVARNDRGVAEDVFHLFTHHPPLPHTPAASSASTRVVEASAVGNGSLRRTVATAAASSGQRHHTEAEKDRDMPKKTRRKRGGRRLREEREKREAREAEAAGWRGSNNNNNNNSSSDVVKGSERDGGGGGGISGEGRGRGERKRNRDCDDEDSRRDGRSGNDRSRHSRSGASHRSGRHRH